MRVGIISGTGTAQWPGIELADRRVMDTAYGAVEVTNGRFSGVEVVHVSRHGTGHRRLSNHVEHRANMTALLEARVDCLVSLTVCGAVVPDVTLGSLVVFDDFYFPSNRMPDGSLATWYSEAGGSRRGHWIFETPFCDSIRNCVIDAAMVAGVPVEPTGCYGHVDGPRFNTRSEVAVLRSSGVTAISQTAGPEIVLAGEAELPMALVGFLTDFANGVRADSEPVEALLERIAASTGVFAATLERALPALLDISPSGVVHRFG